MENSAFVFDPETGYGRVSDIRSGDKMMPAGVHLVASVTGPWNLVGIVDFDDLGQLPALVDAVRGRNDRGDPNTATTVRAGHSKVKRTVYDDQMAFIRIETRQTDPSVLLDGIYEAIGSEEADLVAGDFDILACAAAPSLDQLAAKIFAVRALDGVKRTVSLRVIDYVSGADDAPDDHRLPTGS